MTQLCNYGCDQEAKYQLKNKKWCCSKSYNSCPSSKRKKSIQIKKVWRNLNSKYNSNSYREKRANIIKKVWEDPNSKYNSDSYKEKKSNTLKEIWKNPNNIFNSISCKKNQSKANKLTIKKIKKKYFFFSKIEEMRYNLDKLEEKEIQVHCKNHECENSKEKGGWFTPVYSQIYERIRALEKPQGMVENNFYCSQYCKDNCSLYGLKSDPLKNNNLPYTHTEYQTCRTFVFDRENSFCEYCEEPATHLHHIKPQKLEPFYALDPDYMVACCEKCHYKYGHEGECSTGNLSKIICSIESQKFLNQTIKM